MLLLAKKGVQSAVVGWGKRYNGGVGVAGSILDGVVMVFHCSNSSGRTMALGSTQTLTEMSTGNVC